jgi:hypothetical protein
VLAVILTRDYGISISRHGVGNVLRRAGLTEPKPRRRRAQRQLNDYPYEPGEVGQMDVKHWKKAAFQYDLIDCATRIKYKRLYPGVSPAYTVDFLEHATRFFAPAFSFKGIQTDNGTEFAPFFNSFIESHISLDSFCCWHCFLLILFYLFSKLVQLIFPRVFVRYILSISPRKALSTILISESDAIKDSVEGAIVPSSNDVKSALQRGDCGYIGLCRWLWLMDLPHQQR